MLHREKRKKSMPRSIATILWADRIEQQFNRSQKQLPALTQSVSSPVNRFLSAQADVISAKDSLKVAYEGIIVAEVATVDPKFMSVITKGAHNLNTIYHHKLLRYECKAGFENWAQEQADARVLRYDRGETEIAERLCFKCKDAPSTIKALLHAQAYMNFNFDDGSSGNLIVLHQYKSSRTNREDGIEIVLGTQLMPYYTFRTDRRNRLLVPIPNLPPFISSSNYHGGQALLQMLLMDEFTKNSIELATNGFIEVKSERWREFSKQSGLPESVFKQTITRWQSDGDDGGRFLIKVDKDRYTLGEDYSKELNFLKVQGRLRQDNQNKGRLSVKKREKKNKSS